MGETTAVRIWTIDSGQQLHKLDGHTAEVNSVAIHTEKHLCVSGSSDLTYRIWSLSEGSCLRTISGELSGMCQILQEQ
ncbi:WD40-repeat-containing domain protein, partial [Fusarium solani]